MTEDETFLSVTEFKDPERILSEATRKMVESFQEEGFGDELTRLAKVTPCKKSEEDLTLKDLAVAQAYPTDFVRYIVTARLIIRNARDSHKRDIKDILLGIFQRDKKSRRIDLRGQ